MRAHYMYVVLSVVTVFFAKTVVEFVHEAGHGIFVCLFGGRVVSIYLSFTWPLQLSSITYEGKFEVWQQAWIDGGGILICLIVSFLLQALLLKVKDWRLASPIFWLAFWAFLNPAGYLIIGAVKPFGDISKLIAQGVLSSKLSLVLGLLIFVAGFFSLSRAWVDLNSSAKIVVSPRMMRVSLLLIWLILPITVVAYCIGSQQTWMNTLLFITLSLLPGIVSVTIPSIMRRSFRKDK